MKRSSTLLVVASIALAIAVSQFRFLLPREEAAKGPGAIPGFGVDGLDAFANDTDGEAETLGVADRASAERLELSVETNEPVGHRFHVTDEKGNDLADVRVRTFADSVVGEWRTGRDGSCRIPLPAVVRGFEFLVEKEGYVHQRRTRLRRCEVSIRLQPATTLFGYLVDEESGRSLPRATIVYDHIDCLDCEPDLVRTDETGAYELPGLPRRRELTFKIGAKGMADDLVSFAIREPVDRLHHDFELGRGIQVRGEIVSLVRDTPVAGATLRLWSHHLKTDAAGRFEARLRPRLPLDLTSIQVEAPRHCTMYLVFPEEEFARDGRFRIRLPEAAVVAGRISDPEGNPIAAAVVELDRDYARERELEARDESVATASLPGLPARAILGKPSFWRTETDVDGRFSACALVPGDPFVYLDVRAAGFARGTFAVPPAARPGETVEMELVLTPAPRAGTGRVSGRLTFHGEPVNGGVEWQGPTRRGYGSSGADGSYAIDDLEIGTIELAVWSDDEVAWNPDLCEGARVRLEIEAGRPVKHDFALEPRYASISGHVRFEDGRPAPGFEVDITCDEIEFGLSGAYDPDGSFSFSLLDGGHRFTVGVYCLDEFYARDDVPPGATGIDIVLPTLGKVLLRVRGARTEQNLERFAAGWRHAGETPFRALELEGWGTTDSEGWTEAVLPIGSIDLIVHAGPFGYRSAQRSDVLVTSAAEGTRVEVLLEPGLEAAFVLAPGQGSLPPEHDLLVIESVSEGESTEIVERLRDRYPTNAWVHRRAWFGEGRTAKVRGLAPGTYRLVVVPDDLEVRPAEIEVREGDEKPTVLRWTWD